PEEGPGRIGAENEATHPARAGWSNGEYSIFLEGRRGIIVPEGGRGMGKFTYQLVEETAKELYIRALKILPPDVREALKKAYAKETNPTAKEIFKTILANVDVADKDDMLICQDTGLPIYMVKIGSKFPVDGAKI